MHCLAISESPRQSDAQLIAATLAGSPEKFAELVRRYQDRLVGYLFGLLGDLDEAHELAVRVLREIYRDLPKYDTRYRFSTWLFWLAGRRAGERDGRGAGTALQQAIRRLPAPQRRLILLRHYGRLSLDEIGNLQGRPPVEVRREISAARRTLAGQLRG